MMIALFADKHRSLPHRRNAHRNARQNRRRTLRHESLEYRHLLAVLGATDSVGTTRLPLDHSVPSAVRSVAVEESFTTALEVEAGGSGASTQVAISAEGRFVAFESTASNLVPHDDNVVDDVFVFDRQLDRFQSPSLASIVLTGAGQTVDTFQWAAGIAETVRTVDIRGSGANQVVISRAQIETSTPDQDLLIVSDPGDEISFESGWTFTSVELIRGQWERSFVNGLATVRVVGPHDWTNPVQATDVNGQNGMTALDALNVINAIAIGHEHANALFDAQAVLVDARTIAPERFFFYDVNGDLALTPRDALNVINALGRQQNAAEAEPILVAMMAADPVGDSIAEEPFESVGLQSEADRKVCAVSAQTKRVASSVNSTPPQLERADTPELNDERSSVVDQTMLVQWDWIDDSL
ncbi:hypothetical protein Enr13x_36110 [Stieleria neptunia]|uniref:Dockerin type I repeat protein n=1 Tax=Stieleria neptunia TaxID=2527979 RepID=A0A518HSB8_9BACT|nr:dockerin type I domain-containing protein [Stieleria neptunia]QDV43753.1 hypothetical protein Enr13x_36110 [Stieleria neptunia]